MLLSDAFKDEEKGMAPDQIDVTYLMCMGLLHCQGKPKEKAEVFYNILQDGGFQSHTYISAADKDLEPAFKKMVMLSTTHLFEWAKEMSQVECPFEDNYAALEDTHEDLRENEMNDEVYGNENKLNNDEWVAKMILKKQEWVFSASLLRKKVF